MIPSLLGPIVVGACLADQPALQTEAPRETTNAIGMRLITVPAGEFDMGSREPAHKARVIRGGGWDYYAGGRCQSACRAAHTPSSRYDYLGFRVAAVPADR
jgi:formylglycine-generating enzyme required for sulfatase activity